jgi:hypothetical protein
MLGNQRIVPHGRAGSLGNVSAQRAMTFLSHAK